MAGKLIPFQTYIDGAPYRPARGRAFPRTSFDDLVAQGHAVIDLRREQPSVDDFLQRIVRELRIRFYQPKSIKAYHSALAGLLRWLGGKPHELTREDLRVYLELLVDGGASDSWVSLHISAVRTAFDKMCGGTITLGLITPRRGKRAPVVLAHGEILRLLEAAPSIRDKLLLGLMYASGLRVSEVVRLTYRDLDRERRIIRVRAGKGRKDRQVMLPDSFDPLLRQSGPTLGSSYVFASPIPDRHLSPRAAHRIMERAVRMAGIAKEVSCHSLRHSFATHLLESGVDVRFIQKLLGHQKLETTRLYTHVASLKAERVASPLDRLLAPPNETPSLERVTTFGRLRAVLSHHERGADVVLYITSVTPAVRLDGVTIKEQRPGWLVMDLPPLEQWADALRQLPPPVRDRFDEPSFYEQLKRQLTQTYLAERSQKLGR